MAERAAFIRTVIYESPADRQSLRFGRTGEYDVHVLVAPEFTVWYLAAASNLPDMLEEWTADGALMFQMMRRVLELRSAYRAPGFPWPASLRSAALKELPMRRGALMFMMRPRRSGDSAGEALFDDGDYGVKSWMQLEKDPQHILSTMSYSSATPSSIAPRYS